MALARAHLDPLPRLGAGEPLAAAVRDEFEARLGVDLSRVRIHTGASAKDSAVALGARAFAHGLNIVFGAGEFSPSTDGGRRLLAHELAHVLQQQHYGLGPTVQRAPACAPVVDQPPVPGAQASPPVAPVPDDTSIERGIVWPQACEKNRQWWEDLKLTDLSLIRDLDPEHQPYAWANKTLRAQRVMVAHHLHVVEGEALSRDGVLGPRSVLALLLVAQDKSHAARAEIQGLGFDLDKLLTEGAHEAIYAARAYARKAEFLIQADIRALGENAVRYYDQNYTLVIDDRDSIDRLVFGGPAPENVRRGDRIELLKRLYGRGGRMLDGTVAMIRVKRDFLHTAIDFGRTVLRDTRQRVDRRHWFNFAAQTRAEATRLDAMFGVIEPLNQRAKSLPQRDWDELQHAAKAFATQASALVGGPQHPELVALLVVTYLPELAPEERKPIVDTYLAEKAERERAEQAEIETHNREIARQRADRLIVLINADDMYHPVRMGRFRTELEANLRESSFFDLVLDDLAARPGNLFIRLYDTVEDVDPGSALGTLVELSLAGRYRDHERVRRALATVITGHAGRRRHGYIADGDGAVLLNGETRVDVGKIVGLFDSVYLRTEKREQLKPDARTRLTTELERESRAYIARLLEGSEPKRTQDEVGQLMLQKAWQAAHLNPDKDVEDVEFQDSIRLLGVRRAAQRADGIPRYDVQYEVVERVVGGSGGDTDWVVRAGSGGWRTEYDFEYAMFWYEYAKSAKFAQAAIKVVLIGAVLIIAWEVGLIAALVAAGGGAIPVGLSIGISVGIYMITHQRWTLEGLLVAAITGYLGAVGFRVFAPVGQAAGRLILPTTAKLVIPATLEQVAFRQVVAAWLVRHAVTGALAGATTGPATLFVEDLINVARLGGGFRPFSDYIKSAGYGLVLGAVFEIGGSVLLAPIFRIADRTVLSKLSDVVRALRTGEKPITPSQWLSETAGALSNFRGWLGQIMDDALANGILATARERVALVGQEFLIGVRGTIQREVLELAAGVTLSRSAVDGLERLLRLGRGALSDDALSTLLMQARRSGNAEPWLRFLGGLDEASVQGMLARNQLRGLIDAEAVLALSGRRAASDLKGLLTTRFGDSLENFNQFARRLNALDDALADRALGALATRGTAVSPRSLLRMAESVAGLSDELLSGLQRLRERANGDRLDQVLDAMANDQVAPFLQSARRATEDELAATTRVIASFEPREVAWAVRVPINQAERLLNQLRPSARAVIMDITPGEAQDLIAALGVDRVNNALSLGGAEPLRGSHLVRLRRHLHDETIRDWLQWAGNASRIRRVQRLATAFQTGAAQIPAGAELTATSIVLDSNALFAIEDLMRGVNSQGNPVRFASLTPNRQDAINALRRSRGLPVPYVDPPLGAAAPTFEDIVGPGVDLRAGAVVSGETLQGAAAVGTSPVLARVRGLNVARGHPDYVPVLNDLQQGGVGGTKGALDRAMVVDAMFSPPTGVTPRIVTTDQDILTRLARFATPPFAPAGTATTWWAQLMARYPSNTFRISIRGHELEVLFR